MTLIQYSSMVEVLMGLLLCMAYQIIGLSYNITCFIWKTVCLYSRYGLIFPPSFTDDSDPCSTVCMLPQLFRHLSVQTSNYIKITNSRLTFHLEGLCSQTLFLNSHQNRSVTGLNSNLAKSELLHFGFWWEIHSFYPEQAQYVTIWPSSSNVLGGQTDRFIALGGQCLAGNVR
jgi:hypothetical protein